MLTELFSIERNPDLRHRIDSCWDHYDLGMLAMFGLANVGIDATRGRVTFEFKKGDDVCVDVDISADGVGVDVYEDVTFTEVLVVRVDPEDPTSIEYNEFGEVEFDIGSSDAFEERADELKEGWEIHDFVSKSLNSIEELKKKRK